MQVKSQKDARRGIGFGAARGESDDSDKEPEVHREKDGSRGMVQKGTQNGSAGKLRAARSPEYEDAWQAELAGNAHEEKFHIGSIYDADAMALKKHQQERVSGGRPLLGSFDLATLPQEVHAELGGAQPWWEDQETLESSKEADSKRQRMMQNQLEAHLFELGGVLHTLHSRPTTQRQFTAAAPY